MMRHNQRKDRAANASAELHIKNNQNSSSSACGLEWVWSRLSLRESETKSFHKTAALDGIKKRNSDI